MTLKTAARTFSVKGLDQSKLVGQKEAFKICLEFFDGVAKLKRQNTSDGSYGLKHIIENPTGRFAIPYSADSYNGYIYEGTCILAALASGFAMEQDGEHLKVSFNISRPSLRQRAKEFAHRES